jgi:hypothetical protein
MMPTLRPVGMAGSEQRKLKLMGSMSRSLWLDARCKRLCGPLLVRKSNRSQGFGPWREGNTRFLTWVKAGVAASA